MTPSEKRLLAVLGRFESFWDLKHRVESLWFKNLMIMRKVSDEFRGELDLLLDTKHDEMRARREMRSIARAQDEKSSLDPEIH